MDGLGTEEFLDLEGKTLLGLSCENTVIAPGGSCIYRDAAMEHLKELGLVVYLKLPYEEVEQRIHNLDSRGITFRPGESLRDLYEERTPLYERYADLTVETCGLTPEESADRVERALPL